MTWVPKDDSKYLSRWKYVEVAKHVPPPVDKVIRYQKNKQSILLEWDEVSAYANDGNNTGIYSSVWLFDNPDIDLSTRFGSLYFDLDSDNSEESHTDSIRLVEYLAGVIPESAIRIYFTGAKGFHIECEAYTLGITPTNDLPGLFRYIAEQLRDNLSLNTLDFAVYDLRRMWRYPNSRHQKSGLYKVHLTRDQLLQSLDWIRDYAKEPRPLPDFEQEFNAKANEWYREWTYKKEAVKSLSVADRIAQFNKYGTQLVEAVDDADLIFDPEALFTHCPAVLWLWEKAENEHHLLHEERLFLCSLLTYTDEAVGYLHTICSNCDDYNPDKTQSHVDDWVRRRELGIGGRPYSCERANSVGFGCGSCDLEPKPRYYQVGNKKVNSGELAQPSPIRFAYKKKKNFPQNPITSRPDFLRNI